MAKKAIKDSKMFRFTGNRKPYPGLSTKRNLHNDSRHKKTYPEFLKDSE